MVTRIDRILHHRLARAGLVLLLVVLLWRLGGHALTDWAVGLGMDEERGALIASLLTVLLGAGVATILGDPAGSSRLGALAALVAIEIVPFLVGAARTGSTAGLATSTVPLAWVAQPLGMLLLGWIAVTAGAALGTLLRADVLGAWARVRRHRFRWTPVALIGLVGLLLALPAATTALQDGSIAALYSYATNPDGSTPTSGHHVRHGVVAAAKGVAAHAPAGHLDRLVIGGRKVEVYLPAAYATETAASFPVIYFLHGYPSTELQWLSGAQLPGVLDQLIATRVMPPLIAVLPNGDGTHTADAEWGDTTRGDRVESWLVDQALPAIDTLYRTLGAHHRGIAGLSSGGFGALNIATHHPDLFTWAASYSGYFSARRDLFAGAAGPQNTPALTAERVPTTMRMPIYIGVGTGDGHYLDANEAFDGELRRLGWDPVSFDVVPGGHGWPAWRLEMVDSLEWLGTLWPVAGTPVTAPVD